MLIDKETAELEFNRFIEAMDLEMDDSSDAEDKDDYMALKGKLVKAISKGSLIIDDKGQPVYTPERSDDQKPLTFYEPTGANLIAMDKRKAGEDISKFNAVMAEMCKVHPKVFARMKFKDYKMCQSIVTLFLA